MHRYQCNPAPRGFTLIEAMVAVFVVAMATAGIASLLAASSQQAAAMRNSSVSQSLARQLMEEIAAKPVNDTSGGIDNGPENGEASRGQFNTVDDYHGYGDTTDSIQMLDGTSIDLGDGEIYTRWVAVEYRLTPGGAASLSNAAPFCVVTVTITDDGGTPVKLVRLFARSNG